MIEKIPCTPQVGADIEYFAMNVDKNLIPCVGYIPGTKESPHTPDEWPNGYAMQEDNIMVEVNIPPSTDYMNFAFSILDVQKMTVNYLEGKTKGKISGLSKKSHAKFSEKDLSSPQAKIFGCEPDFDAYSGGTVRQIPQMNPLMRTCGGHVHLGGDFQCPDFVAALFAELYISVYANARSLVSNPRRKSYGAPGAYRPKPYGIEYRTPDNKWTLSMERAQSVGHAAMLCARYLTETDASKIHTAFQLFPWEELREYMDHSPKHTRSKIIQAAKRAGIPL